MTKQQKFLAATTPMYEALFGETLDDAGLTKGALHSDITIPTVLKSAKDKILDGDECDCTEVSPRSSDEIHAAIDILRKQVWYNRHMNLRWGIKEGEIKIVSSVEWREKKLDELKYPECQNYIGEETWAAARKNAKLIESELGKENLGPWTDFEWGMLNGKLSALRWAVGNDWDFLDT